MTEVKEYIENLQKIDWNYETIEETFECNIKFNLFDMRLPIPPY